MLYEKLENNNVQCALCNHRCKIAPGKFGTCGVRQNVEGTLYTLVYGEAIATHVDPIEKKPLYHFLPGTNSYSIASIGCNFKCGFCQNWQISQINKKKQSGKLGTDILPEDVVKKAMVNNCKSISYTYTEPTIFFEYAFDTAKAAKEKGIYNVFVTNGYMAKEAIDEIKPYLDAANVDLKSFKDEYYKKSCGARLQPVVDNIAYMHKNGIWVEVTTLIIPGLNDSTEELFDIAKFIGSVDDKMPWHISRFQPNYKMTESEITPIATMKQAMEIGKEVGLKYVYLGNVNEESNTFCHNCGNLLVRRKLFSSEPGNIEGGKCNNCWSVIPGKWEA